MRLVEPSMEWQNEHKSYVEEWGPSRLVPSSFNISKFETYADFLDNFFARQKGDGNWVPSSGYMLIDDNKALVGMVDIRHELNEDLLQIGGHVGYGIRPTERGKGYATRILAEALKKCKELNIPRVLVTCDKENIGSAKVIIKNGGVEDESFIDKDGKVIRRFWIQLF
ncbi:GNAT family N-acetyltransferase [Oceanobacillus piezotolerans]|uniref:GNAT family N-acetyltransferase n=1 Tax=Oceanobacillus piezotolerans TaxID=2448030 RepID=A0A498DEM6_9BACI|nr:GNAT family N-acetyltransferase [Oceanobacillus piezotolerans]RLL41989.1 GNAT family N-acetyltransferase [Oceanobacillus piezotolerans]